VTVAGSGEKWRWADPQGVQRVIHTDELRSALASAALPPYTLVWKPGMPEWVPAYQAAELATHAISAQQGLISNIPPPPLAIIAVQAEFEHRASGFDEKKKGEPKEEEPPPPPVHQYAKIAAAVPAPIMQAAQAAAQPRAAAHPHAPPAAAAPAPAPVPVHAPAPVAPIAPVPAPDFDDLKTWVAKPAIAASAVGAKSASLPQAATSPNPPAVVPRAQPTAPKAPITAPPRATASVPPHLPPPSHPVPAGPARHLEAPPSGQLPPLPGAFRSGAPPPPPPPRSRPGSHGHALPGHLPLPMPHAPLPHAPMPHAPDAKSPFEMHAPPPVGLPAPQTIQPSIASSRFAGNGEAPPMPRLSSGPPPPPKSGHPNALSRPSVHDLPAFPLDEIQPEDIEEDDENGSPRPASEAAEPAKEGFVSLASHAQNRLSPLAGRTRNWLTNRVGPAIEDGFAYVKANPKDPKVMLGVGGAALLFLLLLIAVAATTSSKSGPSPEAELPSESKPTGDRVASPAAGKAAEPFAATEGRPARASAACRLTKEAVRIAEKASKDVPLELTVSSSGDRARMGFATDAGAAQGLSIDLGSFKVSTEFSAPAKGKVRAVVPLGADAKPSYVVNGDGPNDKLQAWRTLSGDPPLVIGWADGAIAVASKPSDPPVALWPLDGDEVPDAIRAARAGDLGHAVVFRRHGEIFGGTVDADRKPRGNLVKIAGAGAPAGSPIGAPIIASNGHAVALTFADRASSAEPWGIRIGSAPLGSFPTQTSAFGVPAGGPGRAAIAPSLSGLSDGRWLLVWTEGSGGDHDVRAQTLDAELRPTGSPFTVSHEGGNAGQAAAALSSGQGIVSYLTLTDQGYEVWGAAVDCR
jgi:GYF domain 2